MHAQYSIGLQYGEVLITDRHRPIWSLVEVSLLIFKHCARKKTLPYILCPCQLKKFGLFPTVDAFSNALELVVSACLHLRRGKFMSRSATKPAKSPVRPPKTQVSLHSRAVAKDPNNLQTDSENFDQTVRMHTLILDLAAHSCDFVGFVVLRQKSEAYIYV